MRQASRAFMTGTAQTAGVTAVDQSRKTYPYPATGPSPLSSMVECGKLIADLGVASSFAGSNVSDDVHKSPSTNQFCPGSADTIMVPRVARPMPSYLPVPAFGTGGSLGANTTGLVNDVPDNPGWKHLLIATSAMQVENFGSSQHTPPSGRWSLSGRR